MIVVGVTGSFGTGKSFVTSLLRRCGAAVIDADKLAHKALKKDGPCYGKVLRAFGPGLLNSEKEIDRNELANIVFRNPKALQRLTRIIHPTVKREIRKRVAVEKKRASKKATVIDAPLLIEADLASIVDFLVVVTASLKTQIERARHTYSRKDVLRRIRSQMPLERKAALADFIIDNNGTRTATRTQVKELWDALIQEGSKKRPAVRK